ncbi:hypothetical protein PanWU01x14_344540 [Parasponia andersonii]|uniref:LRR domain containing protein n=1 Tax=Parasponia andersonii TaxID=3476 RepID=A0A2P5AD05_PARAD|nr:hypothetical protein PanWU01x14_344540 [Parasponia andersonii]
MGIQDHERLRAIELWNVFVENVREALDLKAMVKATMKDSNKLISGTFSTVYTVQPISISHFLDLGCPSVWIGSQLYTVINSLHPGRTLSHLTSFTIENYAFEDIMETFPDQGLLPTTISMLIICELDFLKSLDEKGFQELVSLKEPCIYDYPNLRTLPEEGLPIFLEDFRISDCRLWKEANFWPLVVEIEKSKLLDPSSGTPIVSAFAGSFGYIPLADNTFHKGVDLVKRVLNAPARGKILDQIIDMGLTMGLFWLVERKACSS